MGRVILYEVGGCVRDAQLGVRTKDIDFAVEAESYDAMRLWMLDNGFEIFLSTPEYLTVRAHFPKGWDHGMPLYGDFTNVTADFVLCRKEGAYSDGRRPDEVEPGTIYDDLARRDFTVNAMAKDPNGKLLDPHGGITDIKKRLLRCVGSPRERFTEDALRAVRALRFRVTKDFAWDDLIWDAMSSEWLPPLMDNVSVERIRDELHRTFKHDTLKTMEILQHDVSPALTKALFREPLWLAPTMKE